MEGLHCKQETLSQLLRHLLPWLPVKANSQGSQQVSLQRICSEGTLQTPGLSLSRAINSTVRITRLMRLKSVTYQQVTRFGVYILKISQGFPGGAVVGNLPANAGDTGSSPGLGGPHMPRSNQAREPQLLSLRVWSLCSATREAAIVRGPRTAMKGGPRLPQLEKALAQKRRPNTAKN